MDKLELAKWLHDNYEEVANNKGWNTQENCKVEFDALPDANKSTMIEIADRLLNFNLLSKHFVSGSLGKKNHRWSDADRCINCGIERKKRPVTKNLMSYGKYLYDYNINGEWVDFCPNCH